MNGFVHKPVLTQAKCNSKMPNSELGVDFEGTQTQKKKPFTTRIFIKKPYSIYCSEQIYIVSGPLLEVEVLQVPFVSSLRVNY